jgi:hypothetical protein|tara:strand:- start:469 stop:639 length:171 start_codon:yes stop_codon:yes gene_type:complete
MSPEEEQEYEKLRKARDRAYLKMLNTTGQAVYIVKRDLEAADSNLKAYMNRLGRTK